MAGGFHICLCLFLGALRVLGDEGLQAQVDALKAQLAEKELAGEAEDIKEEMAGEDKSSLVDGLMQVMKKLSELEANPPGPAPAPVKNEKVEEAVKAFEDSMKQGGSDESQPIPEDELHACGLMAARHFTADAGRADIAGTPADAAWILLTRLVDTKAPLSPGEASKTALFKSVAVCVKKFDKDALSGFKKAGGFLPQSTFALPEAILQENENKKTAITWQGEVFQLGFKKERWGHLRRVVASFLKPPPTPELGSGNAAGTASQESRAEL